MHHVRCLTLIFTLLATAAAAQTFTMENLDAARAGVRVGYGGHGADWNVSADSPRLASLVRVRADIGHGSWVGINSAGHEPDVTRLGVSALMFLRRHDAPPSLFGYVGFGFIRLIPHREGLRKQSGRRLLLGMEGSAGRWSVGPEFEIDITGGHDAAMAQDGLLPTIRLGLALRRRF
jgi:hypothetical protein